MEDQKKYVEEAGHYMKNGITELLSFQYVLH